MSGISIFDKTAQNFGRLDETIQVSRDNALNINDEVTTELIYEDYEGDVKKKGAINIKGLTFNNDFAEIIISSGFTIGTGFNTSAVYGLSLQADGKVFAGGGFTQYNDTPVNKTIRLNTDGSIDNTFEVDPLLIANCYFIRVDSNNKFIVSGAVGVRLARLNADGSVDNSFNVGTGCEQQIEGIEIQSDGKIIAVGFFDLYNGNTVNKIVRVNTDGSIDNTFNTGTGFGAGPTQNCYDMAKQTDGKLIIIGNYSFYNGSARNRIVRLNTDGTLDNTFSIGTGFASNPEVIVIQSDGKVIVGGAFTQYNGTTSSKIIRLNTDGSVDSSFTTNIGTGFNSSVWAVSLQSDGKIVCGGLFTSFNGTSCIRIARLNSDGTLDNTFNTGTGFGIAVRDIAINTSDKIFVGGEYTEYNGNTRNRIVQLNADGSDNTITS